MAEVKGGGMGQDPDYEKTVRIDTGSMVAANATVNSSQNSTSALNLDFLDLPEDPNLTVPAPAAGEVHALPPPGQDQPPANPMPPGAPSSAPSSAPSGLSHLGTDAPRLTSTGVFGGIRHAEGTSRERLVKLGALFLISFAIAGGMAFLINATVDDSDDFAFDTTVSNAPSGNPDSGVSAAGLPGGEPAETSFFGEIYSEYLEPVLIGIGLVDEPPLELPDLPVKKKKKVVETAVPPPAETAAPGAQTADSGNSPVDAAVQGPGSSSPAVAGAVDKKVTDPYLAIPNVIDRQALDAMNQTRRFMSVSEGQGWQAAVAHKFPYQHYRAVEEMRKLRTKGSESILRSAMTGDAKLWVRMAAALALVESGELLTASEVERAVIGAAGVRRQLLSSYFKRFEGNNNLAERYVLKFALPLVPPAGRVSILKALVNAGDPDADLYTIAGSFDESIRVRRWAVAKITRDPSILLRMDEYRSAIKEHGLDTVLKSAVAGSRAGEIAGRTMSVRRPPVRTFANRPISPPGGDDNVAGVGSSGVAVGSNSGSIQPVVEYYGAQE